VDNVMNLLQKDTEAQIANRDRHLNAAKQYESLAGIAHTKFQDAGQAAAFMYQREGPADGGHAQGDGGQVCGPGDSGGGGRRAPRRFQQVRYVRR
jgi:hypothetical protein